MLLKDLWKKYGDPIVKKNIQNYQKVGNYLQPKNVIQGNINVAQSIARPIRQVAQNVGNFAQRDWQNSGLSISNPSSLWRGQTAVAPAAVERYKSNGVMDEIPLVQRSNETKDLINKTINAYGFTPQGTGLLRQQNIMYPAKGVAPNPNYDAVFMQGDNQSQNKIVLNPTGIALPQNLTHEFIHSQETDTGTLTNKSINAFYNPKYNKFWNARKQAWGDKYMSYPGMELGERQAVFGTEIPSKLLIQELKNYYGSLFKAGKQPQDWEDSDKFMYNLIVGRITKNKRK